MRVAISHDYLTQRGGAERVVLSLSDAYPQAPIYTSVYLPEGTFAEFAERDVRPGVLDRIGPIRRHHRMALPLYPLNFEAQRIDADVAICSSSGWAHGARVTGRKVVYCHAPARWLYQRDVYLAAGFGALAHHASRAVRRPLLWWDRRAAATADLYLANSTRTQTMIRDAYGVEAEVLPPPHSVDATGPQEPVAGLDPGFHLTVSRLMAYKNVRQLVEAYRGRTEQLVVVGDGPLATELRATAPANVVLLGRVTDDQLRWLYATAATLVAVSYEDLGLTPVEAALFGTPALALRFGGYLDTVIDGVNGGFIEEPTPAAITRALDRFDPAQLDAEQVRRSADRFDRRRFEARLASLLDDVVRDGDGPPGSHSGTTMA
jgi:glycosyltransferase involved in cell wall biosynthesis